MSLFKRICRGLIQLELLWLFVLTPFLFFPSPQRLWAVVAIPSLWLLRWIAWKRIVPRTPLDWPLLLMLLMIGVSLWATFDPLFSLPKVTGALLGIAFYYALVEVSKEQRSLTISLLVLILVTLGITGLSLIGTQWAGKFSVIAAITNRIPQLVQNVPGSPASGFNPNSVAGALLFTFPVLTVLVWPFKRGRATTLKGLTGWRYVLFVVLTCLSFFLIGGTLVLTQSRGGYLGMLVGVSCLLILPRRGLFMLATTLVLLVGGIVWNQPELIEPYFSEAAPNALESGVNSLQGRIEIWSRAWYGIQDFPFTGMGMGTFRRVVPILYPLFTISPDADIGHAHNQWLAAGVDLGIPGLVSYIALWLGSAGMLWQVWQVSLNANDRLISLGLASGLAAHFTWGVFDANVLGSKAGFVFWLMLGTIASLHTLTFSYLSRPIPTPKGHLGDSSDSEMISYNT